MLTFENDFPLKKTIHTFDFYDLVKSNLFLQVPLHKKKSFFAYLMQNLYFELKGKFSKR